MNLYYKAELEIEGLAEKISKGYVISYASQLEKLENPCCHHNLYTSNASQFNTNAAIEDKDLYYTKSIFVTTNANLNDDYFDPKEVWSARHTPSHKPTNIEHDEKKLVGHMTDCWAVNAENQSIISDDSPADNLPPIYHLVNGAVIYRAWQDQALSERANKLIDEIEAGEKFVSMECLFTNFDYAVTYADGTFEIKPRNETNAYLTKHLRAYGGTGKYNDMAVKRLLRNITFSGKGYVDRPANPESIVFKPLNIQASINPNLSQNLESGVNLDMEQNTMNKEEFDVQLAAKQTELDAALASLESEKTAKAEVEAQLLTITEANTNAIAQLAEANAQIEAIKVQASELATAKTDLETRVTALEEEIRVTKVTTARMNQLVEGGIAKDIAAQKVDMYANLTDEQFTDIANELIGAAKCKIDKAKEKEDKEEEVECKSEEETKASEVVAETELDNAEVEKQAALAAQQEQVDEVQKTRTILQTAMAKRLGLDI
jgi:hypothetical protein